MQLSNTREDNENFSALSIIMPCLTGRHARMYDAYPPQCGENGEIILRQMAAHTAAKQSCLWARLMTTGG
jgi:hypothetical protein